MIAPQKYEFCPPSGLCSALLCPSATHRKKRSFVAHPVQWRENRLWRVMASLRNKGQLLGRLLLAAQNQEVSVTAISSVYSHRHSKGKEIPSTYGLSLCLRITRPFDTHFTTMTDQYHPGRSSLSQDHEILDYADGTAPSSTTLSNANNGLYPSAGSSNHSLPIDRTLQPSIGSVPPDSTDAITVPGYPAYNRPPTQPGSFYDGRTLVSFQTRQSCQKRFPTAKRDVNHQSGRFFELEPVARQYHYQP
jgi:hypothetical protein